MKHEWRKKEKSIYLPKNKPELIEIPEFQFITLSGEGNPNSPFFAKCIEALYAMSYAIKMNLKKVDKPPKGYQDWAVYPLEGHWDVRDEVKNDPNYTLNKDDLVFDLMIRQPDFISQEFFEEMLNLTKKKKPNDLLDSISLERMKDGKCIQMLHIGSFDDEPESFQRMEEFATEKGLKRKSKKHREIYLSDFRKVPQEKMKTTLRFQVQ